jgi:uncharacterized membrane protein
VPPSSSSRRTAPIVAFVLAVAGLGLSIYLTWVHYDSPKSLSCPDTGVINCLKVTTSPQSELFGFFPVALSGLIYYVVMLALTSRWAWRVQAAYVSWLRIAGAVAGVGMVAYLVYVEAVEVKAICLYCTAVHVITFVLFVTILVADLLQPIPELEELGGA